MHALLAGLTTLDVIHALDHEPNTTTKTTCIDHAMAAGGPATNAAVTIAALDALQPDLNADAPSRASGAPDDQKRSSIASAGSAIAA
ncbi:hypothetical protein [Schaalia hyovaginalis]|uniref:Carbohydrate kinase PfkB domain-containing protein n=1 Tax=Schaalia hyovaginalis TaxID=29316 RepID=A0A923IXX2_9ACTO|nr:hypothetical protein [Schaalia hyovaginalis]